MMKKELITERFKLAKEYYSQQYGVDVDKALKILKETAVSINCWQGDDVAGFERADAELSGGIAATGNYPGAAKTPEQLRNDLEFVFSKIPGKKRLNLHASYLEAGGEKVDRDEIEPKHYSNWVDWAKKMEIGLDFNPTLFSHEFANDGLTLSHPDKKVRDFWIEHVKRCRKVSEYFGRELGTASTMNIWIPDGFKDIPFDKLAPRKRLSESLDAVLAEKIDKKYHIDAVESKLFGLGSESYVVGSHEFYMGYAMKNNIALTLDSGHFHPTEVISNKISSISMFVDDILLHVSRPVRWDSDHVVTLDNELMDIASEIVRGNLFDRVHIGLDFFDASINRLAAWIIGTRNMMKAMLMALLEPQKVIADAETEFDFTSRLAYLEELKSSPWQDIWDYYCETENVPVGIDWLADVKKYEKENFSNR